MSTEYHTQAHELLARISKLGIQKFLWAKALFHLVGGSEDHILACKGAFLQSWVRMYKFEDLQIFNKNTLNTTVRINFLSQVGINGTPRHPSAHTVHHACRYIIHNLNSAQCQAVKHNGSHKLFTIIIM